MNREALKKNCFTLTFSNEVEIPGVVSNLFWLLWSFLCYCLCVCIFLYSFIYHRSCSSGVTQF
jgi:hypothetical protein